MNKLADIIDEIKTVKNKIANASNIDEVNALTNTLDELSLKKLKLEQNSNKTLPYLDSKASFVDFVNAFKNAKNMEEGKKAWEQKLIQNAVTFDDVSDVLPKRLELELKTELTRSNPIFQWFRVTHNGGTLVLKELTSEDTALIHRPGEKKVEQQAKLRVSRIDPVMIYKMQSIYEIVKRNLSNFEEYYSLIVAELVQAVIDKIVDLVIFEGTASETDPANAPTQNGFVSIANEKDAKKVAHVDGKKSLSEGIIAAVNSILLPNRRKALIVTPAQKAAIRESLKKENPTTLVRNSDSDLADYFNVDEILVYLGKGEISPTVITENSYIVDMSEMTKVDQFQLEYNNNLILVETSATGQLVDFRSAAVVDVK